MGMTRKEAVARIEALPERFYGEFVGGELVVSPRPASPHGHAATALTGELFGPFQRSRGGPGGWWFHIEPELHLGDDILIPDLAGWRTSRMPVVPDTPAFTLAPDWVCEVLSPSTTRVDRAAKLPAYAAAEVEWVWLVDPLARMLEVYRRAGSHWQVAHVLAGNDAVHAPPFDAAPLELAALWLPTPPPPQP